ncbi:MAG: hypothetical protein LBP56_05250 [Odoribacteraceae bacterium]|nr:hypothetical protein [Odoribacteraceae bacterium]
MENNTAPDIANLAPLLAAWQAMFPGKSPEEFAAWIIVPSAERSAFLASRARVVPTVVDGAVITSLEPI